MRNVLKYPGSKWRIADKLIELIPEHHTYLEPFFGSGAVFFKKQPSDIETINDLDGNVVNLFKCIQSDAEHLARIVMTIPFSRAVYDKQFSDSDVQEDLMLKAADFFNKVLAGTWVPDKWL